MTPLRASQSGEMKAGSSTQTALGNLRTSECGNGRMNGVTEKIAVGQPTDKLAGIKHCQPWPPPCRRRG